MVRVDLQMVEGLLTRQKNGDTFRVIEIRLLPARVIWQLSADHTIKEGLAWHSRCSVLGWIKDFASVALQSGHVIVYAIKDPERGECRRNTGIKIELISRMGQMVCELVREAKTLYKFERRDRAHKSVAVTCILNAKIIVK